MVNLLVTCVNCCQWECGAWCCTIWSYLFTCRLFSGPPGLLHSLLYLVSKSELACITLLWWIQDRGSVFLNFKHTLFHFETHYFSLGKKTSRCSWEDKDVLKCNLFLTLLLHLLSNKFPLIFLFYPSTLFPLHLCPFRHCLFFPVPLHQAWLITHRRLFT